MSAHRRWVLFGAALCGVCAATALPPRAFAQPGLMAVNGVVMPPGAGGSVPADKRGLHIPQGRRVSFNYYMTDGAGFRWDIQYYGTVGQGTNNAFSGGMYCQINGSNVQSSGYGWANKTGDEIEIGPYQNNNLRCYRRIKVYRDRGLARWLDIFENATGQDIAVQVTVYTNRCYTIRGMTTSSGKAAFGPGDWAVITDSTNPNGSSVLQIVGDRRSKLRPSVQWQSCNVYLRYNLTVPGGKTVLLCHFVSQGHSPADHLKTLKSFRAARLLKDLSPAVRGLIANFNTRGGYEGVELDRSTTSDTVILRSGDPIYGRITNERFAIQAYFGEVALPAAQVVGMAAGEEVDQELRFAMVGGQVISGSAAKTKLAVALPSGGALNIPLDDIQQWSYRITKERPESEEFSEPYILLRTGDKLAFEPSGLALQFRTRHGLVPLAPEALLEIGLDNRGNAVHRATFRNGSRLGGFLEPRQVTLRLKLGRELRVDRAKIVQIRFAASEKADSQLAGLLLKNGDELFGRIVDDKIVLVTRYNPVELAPENVKSLLRQGQVVVEMWNGTVHKGRLGQESLRFQITPGPVLAVHVDRIEQIVRPRPLPPVETRRLVEQLVAQLGSESFRDRQEATEKLMQIKGIAPLLRKYLHHSDPEVRQRIEEILAKTAETKSTHPLPAGPFPDGAQMWIRN